MYREIKYTAEMTDKEIMYVIASEYVDEICFSVVDKAEYYMSNPLIRKIIVQAAEHKLAYDERRKKIALGEDEADCLYNFRKDDVKAYKTILYDNIFREYGENTHNI